MPGRIILAALIAAAPPAAIGGSPATPTVIVATDLELIDQNEALTGALGEALCDCIHLGASVRRGRNLLAFRW